MRKKAREENTQLLEELIYNACLHLKKQNYVHETLRKYRATWYNFLKFCKLKNIEYFQWEAAEQFLISKGVKKLREQKTVTANQKSLIRYMLNLSEFNLHGSFARHACMMKKSILKAPYDILLVDYTRFCIEQKGIVYRSIKCIESATREFLFFLQIRGLKSASQITGQIIGDYFKAKAHLSPPSISSRATNIRSFLRYLVMRGLVDSSPIEAVPAIRSYASTRIPEVWSQEDIEKLLEAVDRSSPMGKRNYAILILAARLGMRPGDIKNLKLENLKWEENKISTIQGKTGRSLELPLSNEIGSAIIDYLKNGRPKTPLREIFISHKAPISPFGMNDSFHHIITRYRQLAGVKLPSKSTKGLYTLRHSIATHLLEVGTPLETISTIMGHVTPDVTLIYAKADVTSLRQVALDLIKEEK